MNRPKQTQYRQRYKGGLILGTPDTSEMNRPSDKVLLEKLITGRLIRLWVEENNPNFSADQREELGMQLNAHRHQLTKAL